MNGTRRQYSRAESGSFVFSACPEISAGPFWAGAVGGPRRRHSADYAINRDKEHALKGKGPKLERETIINFNEVESNASIWSASEPIYRKLLKLGYTPSEESDRSATFQVPKKLMAVRKEAQRSTSHTPRRKCSFAAQRHGNYRGGTTQ